MLVITRAPWLNDNGIGNTLSDFFRDLKGVEIFSLCLREAPNVSELSKMNFYISESQLANALIKHRPVGKITDNNSDDDNSVIQEKKVYALSKKINLSFFTFARELLWSTNIWKNDNLDSFLSQVAPDIIFFPDFPCVYAHKVLQYIHNKTKANVVIYHADDCYTLKQFSISPFFWLYRFYLRSWVRRSVEMADLHYVISDLQKKDYDKAFGVDNKLLTKFADFSGEPNLKTDFNTPLQLIFTGNIGLNRWKTLAVIAKAIKTLNGKGVKAELRIYTGNAISNRVKQKLDIPHCSYLMGYIPAEKIENIQREADVLVHVESMDLKHRLVVRQSFSTKIVDYLKSGRAILAVGPQEVASIMHLKENKCAFIASDEDEIISTVEKMLSDSNVLNNMAKQAYICGRRFHNRSKMLEMLYRDLENLSYKKLQQ